MNLITKIQELLSTRIASDDDSVEHRRLDMKLESFCKEWRHKEESVSPRLSQNFEERLLHLLHSEPAPSQKSFAFGDLFESRSFQYSLSFALAFVLVVVVAVQIPSSADKGLASQEKTTVILDNSSYLNQPSSAVYSHSNQETNLLQKFQENSQTMDVLLNLEQYYFHTGKVGMANEIHSLIDAINSSESPLR